MTEHKQHGCGLAQDGRQKTSNAALMFIMGAAGVCVLLAVEVPIVYQLSSAKSA